MASTRTGEGTCGPHVFGDFGILGRVLASTRTGLIWGWLFEAEEAAGVGWRLLSTSKSRREHGTCLARSIPTCWGQLAGVYVVVWSFRPFSGTDEELRLAGVASVVV